MITAKEALELVLALSQDFSEKLSEEYSQAYRDDVESRVKFELERIVDREIRTMEKAIRCDESWLDSRKASMQQSEYDSTIRDIADMRDMKKALEKVKSAIEGPSEEDK